jgi:hypothetical protein
MSETAQPAELAQSAEHAQTVAGEAELSGAAGTGIAQAETPTPTPGTADPRVDDALSRLAEIDVLPLAEQVEVYTDIHRRLVGVLADPDSQA